MKLADLRLTVKGAAVIGTISGEVDMSNAAELQLALTEGTPNDAAGLVVDLSSLDYLDSSGIQLLYRLHEDLRTRAQRLLLVIPDMSAVAHTFRLAGVTGSMEVLGDVDQALAALSADDADA